MAIDVTYRKLLTEDYLLSELKKGEIPSAEDLSDVVDALLADVDFTLPQFKADNYRAVEDQSSSVSSFNLMQKDLLRDLQALYTEMLMLTEISTQDYERWGLEADTLEKILEKLENRIENLLLLTKDTEGYHSFLVDNFTDWQLIDRDLTTATVDPVGQIVTLGATGNKDTKVYLNSLPTANLSFKVRNTTDLISRVDAPGQVLGNIFKQSSAIWSTQIIMGKNRPVTCELIVKLGDLPVKISRILIRLNDSARSSPISVTPLYSNDNFNFSQLPTNTYTQEIRSLATFSFEELEATWIKFILIKNGPDPVSTTSNLVYQFGFREISFFSEAFDSADVQQVYSVPLSVPTAADPNEVVEFSKVTLEVCERIEPGTTINYYLTASDDPEVPVDVDTVWVPVTPLSRVTGSQPRVIDLGDIENIEKGVEEIVTISHDPLETDETFINPGSTFHLLSQNADGDILDDIVVADAARYIFTNSHDRILNYQIKTSDYVGSGTGDILTFDEASLVVFRNVGEKGLDPEESTTRVRDVQRGWKFKDPYYITVIEIKKPEGITIDFGDKPVIIDDIRYTNVVSPKVLSGKTGTKKGVHTIKVHKDNWQSISPNLETLDEIQAEDTLYPYNHKLLIEGYEYPSTYSNNQEKIYLGVDLFASELMKRVSIFDLAHSVQANQYKFFALDRDAPETHTDGNESTSVFVVKVDDANTDFPNEQFVIRFNLVNQRYKYLRFRADLSTTSAKVSPGLDSYKIKLGG